MRLVPASFLLLCALNVTAQQTQPSPVSPSHRVNHQDPANNDKGNAGSHAPPSDGATKNTNTTFVLQESAQQNDERGKQPSYWDKVIFPEILPTWILSAIGVVGTIVAVYTLIAIRDEAMEIKGIAEAANRNAQALMLGQRAWVIVQVQVVGAGVALPPFTFKFLYQIFGNSPARVISVRHKTEVLGIDESLPEARDYPEHPQQAIQIVVPGESREIRYLKLAIDFPADAQEIGWNKKVLWFHGIVEYTDIFDAKKILTTGFCFRYDSNTFKRDGPAAYNEAT